MNDPSHPINSQILAAAAMEARALLANADCAVELATRRADAAKVQRKEAKEAASLAKKQLKRARKERAEAKEALTKTEKKLARAVKRESKAAQKGEPQHGNGAESKAAKKKKKRRKAAVHTSAASSVEAAPGASTATPSPESAAQPGDTTPG
jgi:hypothetical protein